MSEDTEYRVFGLKSQQGDLGLKLRLPKNRTPSKHDDVAGTGIGTRRRVVRITAMQSSKVSINIAIQSKSSGWRNDGTLVFCSLQVSDDGLDCTGMTLLGVVVESGNLTDSVGDIWTGVG
jgi:hypothetical protein